MIKTIGVKRCYKTMGGDLFYALKGIDIEIPAKKLTILRGRSGSGKTTLLNIIGALDAPSEGEVYLDGKPIAGLSAYEREMIRRNDIGYVFQSVALIPIMTAYENVEYALRLANYKGDRKKRVMECLHMVGLTKRAQHMPYELSGGEQQRVAIARAIAHEPKIIFADEPTAELDTTTGIKVTKIFLDLIEKENLTIVMTTHDTDIINLGEVMYEMEDGEIVNGAR